MPPPVVVAVVSWNTRALLARCLDALAGDARIGLADVWVVDNGSSDGSRELVADHYPWARLLTPERNLGFGAAVNLVAAQTEGQWLAAANADVALDPGTLAHLLAVAEEHPLAGAVAPGLRDEGGGAQVSVHPFPGLVSAAVLGFGLARLLPGLAARLELSADGLPSGARDVDWAHGAFLLFRRAAWDDVGGFDDEQWMYAEDLDLAWRLHRAGWRVRYEPSAGAVHAASSATGAAFGERRWVRAQASASLWSLRRRGRSFTRALAIVNLAGLIARAGLLLPRVWLGRPGARDRRALLRRYWAMHRTGLLDEASLRALADAPDARRSKGRP